MIRTLRSLFLLAFIALSGTAMAQEIAGRVLDEKKEPMLNAVVQVYTGGILKGGTVTDFDGNYTIKPLDPGFYDVLVMYQGYDSIITTKVVVTPGQRTTMNFNMTLHTKSLGPVEIREYRKPLVDKDKVGTTTLTNKEIATIPTNQITDVVSTTVGVYQSQRGADVSIGGARSTGTLYIIDGVQVQGQTGVDMAQGSVEQIEVISSGISAKYGDVSGGVVNITSRGVAQKLTGNIRLQHSIDGYNNNLASFSIAGPLYKKTVTEGDHTRKKPVLGFALSGDIYDDHDRYPTYNESYITKGSVLTNIQQNPLLVKLDNNGQPTVNLSSYYVTQKDLQNVKIPPHHRIQEDRLNGKLDYQVTDNMHIVAGGTFDYTKSDLYNRARNLFAPEATPVSNTISGRAYVRFTQKFGKAGDTSARHNIISNAYYSVQADFQKLYQDVQDPQFKSNIFEYAYVGKFHETRVNNYFPVQTDSMSGIKGTILLFNSIDNISYERSNLNSKLANYTSQFYNDFVNPYNLKLFSLTEIQAFNGLVNGDEPKYTYDLFYSPGATITTYSKFNSNQYALDVNASFDLLAGKTRHAIEFGLYYQQRIERSFAVSANPAGSGTASLWNLMRGLASSVDNGNLKFDKQHPNFVVGGKTYTYQDILNGKVIPGPSDTIFYNYVNVATDRTFDNNLRKKLHLGPTDNINIDELDPSTFSLSMFSADELLNSGRSFVGYEGYTYSGGTQTGSVNFNDFWSAKDANGNYTRPLGAFSPNYIAGYIQDNFNYKDVHFNVGVRIDRYSANTKVLKDPYSEYGEKTVNQVSGAANVVNGGKHPANIGGNYVVYVDDNAASNASIIGYRNGDTWYDPTGKYISDPATLKQFSGGRDPQPARLDTNSITSNNYNPNLAFTDYTPQVSVQPRLSFSFPVSDVADFFAHYDIYSHRPTGQIDANAEAYYYLQQNGNSYINNANLKPEKTYDYEVGFVERLSDHSAVTISAFYKERKDMITAVPYLFAYPITYYTYGNRDFSTTKGMTLYYDLRATNHLSMNVSYTLQFAEGSGSSPNSRNGLLTSFVEAGVPNLRYITALDYDSRHNITGNIVYRYNQDEGPMIGGKHVFQRTTLNVIARARSGEPYTRYTDALATTVIGGVNGARLPWHFGVDLHLDKDFALTREKKNADVTPGVKPKRPLFLKGILQINNVLQTRDILGVYGYTGRPDDNGYLASPFGQQYVPQQINPQSYTDLYKIAINNPGLLNYARTISLALEFNF